MLLKTLAKRALVNNLLEYLHTAKILSYDFGEGQNYKNFFILTNLSSTLTFLYFTCLGHLEISASASQHQHRHWRRHRHRHCKSFLPFEALKFAFRKFLLSKTSMVKSFSDTLASFPESVCRRLEQLFCRDVVSTCFWRKELRHGRYLRSFKDMQGRKLQLVCLCISDKEPY